VVVRHICSLATFRGRYIDYMFNYLSGAVAFASLITGVVAAEIRGFVDRMWTSVQRASALLYTWRPVGLAGPTYDYKRLYSSDK